MASSYQITSVPGLYYFPNFLTSTQAQIIKADLEVNPNWVPVLPKVVKCRKVIQYGHVFSHAGDDLKTGEQIPAIYSLFDDLSKMDPEIQKVLADWHPDQMIINRFNPGQSIHHHIDRVDQFGPIIASVSLGSSIVIEFISETKEKVHLYVEPNSLYIMSGDARYKWKHGILPSKMDMVNGVEIPRGLRDSLTYRTTNKY